MTISTNKYLKATGIGMALVAPVLAKATSKSFLQAMEVDSEARRIERFKDDLRQIAVAREAGQRHVLFTGEEVQAIFASALANVDESSVLIWPDSIPPDDQQETRRWGLGDKKALYAFRHAKGSIPSNWSVVHWKPEKNGAAVRFSTSGDGKSTAKFPRIEWPEGVRFQRTGDRKVMYDNPYEVDISFDSRNGKFELKLSYGISGYDVGLPAFLPEPAKV